MSINRVFVYKRESYIDEDSFKQEINLCLTGLLREMKNTLHLNTEDMRDPELASKYGIRRDGYKPYGDLGKELYKYSMHGILVLMEERTPKQVTITIPYEQPDYTKSIGLLGDPNYIPSTIDFINSFNPQSGYKK